VAHAPSGHQAARNVTGDIDVDRGTELVRDGTDDPLGADPRDDGPRALRVGRTGALVSRSD
jgi:hypothetical protein